MEDFIKRCDEAIHHVDDNDQLTINEFWLGGLMQPEACVTAMRQLVAQEHGWPLENVQLTVRPLSEAVMAKYRQGEIQNAKNCFIVKTMILEGAEWNHDQLEFSNENQSEWEYVLFEWTCLEKSDAMLDVPVYLNESRSTLLCVVSVKYMQTIQKECWNEKAIALIAWRQPRDNRSL